MSVARQREEGEVTGRGIESIRRKTCMTINLFEVSFTSPGGWRMKAQTRASAVKKKRRERDKKFKKQNKKPEQDLTD